MTKKLPDTIPEFAEACRGLTFDQLVELFEDEIRVQKPLLHSAIYHMSPKSPYDVPEPCREAFNEIGRLYNIKSLIEY